MIDKAILLEDRLSHLLSKLEQDLKRLKRKFQENKESENNSEKETEANQEFFG